MSKIRPRVSWVDSPDGMIRHVLVTLDNADGEYQFGFDVSLLDWLRDCNPMCDQLAHAMNVVMADYARQHPGAVAN